jgi:xanthine dehydrogenase YagR molybdenum-binding subunit
MSDAAPEPRENQGQPLPRIDGRLKVTGEARYAADIPVAHLAHAVLVTSTIARGTVTSISFEAAHATPGVLDIISYEEAASLNAPRHSNSSYTSLHPLKQREIRHDGQIVALVVAETFQAAEEAAAKISIGYERQTPSADLDSPGTEQMAAAGNVPLLSEDPAVGDFVGG